VGTAEAASTTTEITAQAGEAAAASAPATFVVAPEDDDGSAELQARRDAAAAVAQSKLLRGVYFDYIIAADVIYHSDQHEPLLHTIKSLMHDRSLFIFVHRLRFQNDTNFLEPLLDAFQVIHKTAVAEILPAYPKTNLTIYEFALKSSPLAAAAREAAAAEAAASSTTPATAGKKGAGATAATNKAGGGKRK
jgi:hypothetical protein